MTREIRTASAPTCPTCGQPRACASSGLTDRILEAPGTWALRACDKCRLLWLNPNLTQMMSGASMRARTWTHASTDSAAGLPAFAAGYVAGVYGYRTTARPWPRWLRHLAALDDVLGGQVCWLEARCRRTAARRGLRERRVPGPHARTRLERPGRGARPGSGRPRASPWTPGLEQPRGADGDIRCRDLNHVLEHLPDPDGTLRSIAARLAPGGRVAIVTPNPESLGARWFGSALGPSRPAEASAADDAGALARMARDAGLVVERCWTTGRYARFVGPKARGSRRTGRVGRDRPPPVLRGMSLAFQAVEQGLGLVRGAG